MREDTLKGGKLSYISHQHRADRGEDKGQDAKSLPILPRSLLPSLFGRLSNQDRELVLREKIIPVATLPNLTLYGAVGAEAQRRAEDHGLQVVAQIAEQDFRAALHIQFSKQLLNKATFGLKRSNPDFSASQRFTAQQVVWGVVIMCWVMGAAVLLPFDYFYAVISFVFGLFFLSVIGLRLFSLINLPMQKSRSFQKLQMSELPLYSVLVPVFRETGVLNQLLHALSRLNYPKSKLDIKIIVEEGDLAMHRVLSEFKLPNYFEVVVVPAGKPQTKPRALNYALQFARGELLTIYDAEDIPEPMQLIKAAEHFAASPKTLVCLQAELAFYNPNENWLTRQFTIEYGTLFKLILPSLAAEGLPFLLGGTSNHFRTSTLRSSGAWDPFNMTEDADLAIRLTRLGYDLDVLDSVTYEEANTELGNWLQQRSRWLKGFLQTWLVHMRDPVALIQTAGLSGFWIVQATTLGIFISSLFHPFFLIHAVYLIGSGNFLSSKATSFQFLAGGIDLAVLVAGYTISIYAGWRALRLAHIGGWWFSLSTLPIYWLLSSIAGWMALWQFAVSPFHWNKTRHGLSAFQKDRAA